MYFHDILLFVVALMLGYYMSCQFKIMQRGMIQSTEERGQGQAKIKWTKLCGRVVVGDNTDLRKIRGLK